MSAALLALRTLLITPLAARCAAEGRDWATTRLTPRERDLWGQMRGRRSDEWLAGRIAAKDAVAALQISDGSHHPPSWPEITTSSSPEDRGAAHMQPLSREHLALPWPRGSCCLVRPSWRRRRGAHASLASRGAGAGRLHHSPTSPTTRSHARRGLELRRSRPQAARVWDKTWHRRGHPHPGHG